MCETGNKYDKDQLQIAVNTAIQYGNVLQANLNACRRYYESCAIEQQHVDAQNAEIECRKSRLAAANAAGDKCRTCSDGSKSDAAGKCRNEGTINWLKAKIKDVILLLKRLSKEISDRRAWRKWEAWVKETNPPKNSTIICDNKGNYSIQLNKYKGTPCGIEECVKLHEQTHINDANANHQLSGCAGIKPGDQAQFAGDFRKYTECRAYSADIICLGTKLSEASFFCMGKLDVEIANSKKRKVEFGCQ